MQRIPKVLVLTLLAILTVGMAEAKTNVTKQTFGKVQDGTAVDLYTLSDGPYEARIMTYGGVLVSFKAPDKAGKTADVILGFDDAAGFYDNFNGAHNAFFDAIIGRYANRIGKGAFTLDGKKYDLPKNDGPNTLHGGPHGFNNVVWQGKQLPNGVELTYVSKDGEMGFPGNMTATVKYTLTKGDLRIEYSATTDKATVVNLTNHSYFNLAGEGSGDILKHQLMINASKITPVDATLIPTGELTSVDGTPFDFRKSTEIGARINNDDEQLKRGHGYDHNWVLDSTGGKLAEAAEVYEPTSGRVLKVLTDQPGIQFYSGNFLDGAVKGKGGKPYTHRSGLCLETQHFPDTPNHANFPSAELKPGQKYHTVTVFSFSTR
ncbi:aldose 1-epimerase [Candidatus Koribacter versatilis Ellin345]|uniref:Aldose 1-epimerase n=1 Tax=Koribacter versatilis (strain Ellin345) TaxID=204669 RepID=Q1IUX4_KORVE|nr:aldose epimerase family protein [Candidatus Koribacter versatilis]ABF39326.1 aldose 1-epimerase [Candidatus Koribacter versatilis Ellin345]